MGIVKVELVDFVWEPCDVRWSEAQKAYYDQMDMFGTLPGPIEKIPYDFRYMYRAGGVEHRQKIVDWEVVQTYRNFRRRYGDQALAKLREKYLDWMIAERETYLIVGTDHLFRTWIVIGLFYPPKGFDQQASPLLIR